ncbi:MAG: amidohydrolase family protein [Planctomycetes bacterium]|nr:amidohydrolase family protein [Planctomycetota bacterium]
MKHLASGIRGGVPALLLLAVAAGRQETNTEEIIAIRCEKIVTAAIEGPQTIQNGVILIRGRKILKVGPARDIEIPGDATIVEAAHRWALPGFIDLHCHIGGSMRDINDMVHPANPELTTRPTIDPDNEYLKMAVAGGVTTVLYIPGSGTNLSGFGTLMHTAGGKTIDELIVRFPGAMKVAQAWNPERGGGDLGASRMGMWWSLRQLLDRAKAYDEAWTAYETGQTRLKPDRKGDLDHMRGLFQRKYPVIIHTADPRDVMGTARMFHDEYRLPCIISHGEFGGYKVAGELAKRGLPANIGPRLYDFRILVDEGKVYGIPTKYREAGVERLSLNTDAPVIPQEDLCFQASMAVRFGLDPLDAIRAITIEPARAVLIDDRLGSLEPGKDADILLTTGNPLDVRNHVTWVMIGGKVVYDTAKERRRY